LNEGQDASAGLVIAEIARGLQAKGLTLQAIADHLNREGYVARQGGLWGPVQVNRVLDRLARTA